MSESIFVPAHIVATLPKQLFQLGIGERIVFVEDKYKKFVHTCEVPIRQIIDNFQPFMQEMRNESNLSYVLDFRNQVCFFSVTHVSVETFNLMKEAEDTSVELSAVTDEQVLAIINSEKVKRYPAPFTLVIYHHTQGCMKKVKTSDLLLRHI